MIKYEAVNHESRIIDIEYLQRIASREIEFAAIHRCSDCDAEFEFAHDAQMSGHLIAVEGGEWGIAIACEGYHEMR
jgi:hypothetical protein